MTLDITCGTYGNPERARFRANQKRSMALYQERMTVLTGGACQLPGCRTQIFRCWADRSGFRGPRGITSLTVITQLAAAGDSRRSLRPAH
jgi:hypothetical protein